jgi:hypothetical protein
MVNIPNTEDSIRIFSPKILNPAKLSFKIDGAIKTAMININ